MNLIINIENQYSNFSKTERSIADYILKNKQLIKNMTIVELSKNIETSPASVTRFVKRVGCENFTELKMKLFLVTKENITLESEDIYKNISNFYNETLKRNDGIFNKEKIMNLIKDIKKSGRIYIYGVGSSGFTALEIMQRFIRMGFSVSSITDSHMMIINSSVVHGGDLVLGISISGETEAVVNSLKISKANGARTVGVTCFRESSISNYSDEIFIVQNTSFINSEFFINSQFSVMYLFDIISMILLREKQLRNNMDRTIEAIIG